MRWGPCLLILVLHRVLAAGAADPEQNTCNSTFHASLNNNSNCTDLPPRLVPSGARIIFQKLAVGGGVAQAVGVLGPGEQDHALLELKVGEQWSELELELPNASNLSHVASAYNWSNPQLRFVNISALQASHCGEDWVVPDGLMESAAFLPPSTVVLEQRFVDRAGVNTSMWVAPLPLKLLRAGMARVCFSHNGTFAWPSAEVLKLNISLLGLLDTCGGQCDLPQQRVECYPGSPGQCALGFGGSVGGTTNSAVSWSPSYTSSFDNESGAEMDVTSPLCSSGPPALDIFAPGVVVLSSLVARPGGSLHLDLPIAGSAPTTVAICYCANPAEEGRECASHLDFTQQVGILLIYTSAVCDPAEGEICTTRYSSAIMGQRFMISVFCPPLGCSPGPANRLMLIARNSSTNLPSWDPLNGCGRDAHLASWLPRGNCASLTNCSLEGQPRQDRRTWGSPGAWLSWQPEENPQVPFGPTRNAGAERRDLRGPQDVDICFCSGDCVDSTSWFKVGEMRVAATALAVPGASTAPTLPGQEGSLQLGRPPSDANALGLAQLGVMKLLADPHLDLGLAECNAPTTAKANESSSALVIRESEVMTLDSPGVVAVCYCSSTEASDGCPSGGFLLAGRFTVRGPVPDQTFVVSTRGPFHLEYMGYALEATDRVLISESQCNGAVEPTATSLVATGCPVCSFPGGTTTEDITALLLNDSMVGCDPLGSSCHSARIVNITTGPNGTMLVFERDPTLQQGDRIVLGAGVTGGTDSQLGTLQGRFNFLDPSGAASSEGSSVAHEVARGIDALTWHLPLAFSGPDAPNFVVDPSGAEWVRTSRAITRRELLGPTSLSAVPRLHVCWAPSSDTSSRWHDVGTLEFQEPASFNRATVTLIAPISHESVPTVVAFETGDSEYPVGSYGTALVLRFEDADKLAPRTAAGAEPEVGTARSDGSQANCAGFLLETWSSLSDLGFPVPKRCRFTEPVLNLQGRRVLEFEVEFEPQAGLQRATRYQLVINVAVAAGVSISDSVLHIEAMDDLILHPNSAIEGGHALLISPTSPVSAASGSGLAFVDLVSGSDGALSPVGAAFDLIDLDDNSPFTLSLRISGEDEAGLPRGSTLRIILWPVTQWYLGPNASVSCQAPFECAPEAMPQALDDQVGGNMNSILLPELRIFSEGEEVTVSNSSTPVLNISAEGSIVGGFFWARPSVLVFKPAPFTNRYIHPTTGTAYRKVAAVHAALLSSRGHGNLEPFPSLHNALYLRLFLPVFLPAGGNVTIESPTRFTNCGAATPLQRSLLLDNPLRYPGGSLSQGSWSTFSVASPDGLTACRWQYTVAEPAGFLAGSSAYVQLSVQNPPVTVNAANSSEGWHVSMHDTLSNVVLHAAFTVPHTWESQDFATNLAVIRKLPFAQTLPGNLQPGSQHTLQVFFSVAERVGPSGGIEVWAPQGFDFGNPCEAADLADEFYRYGPGPSYATLDRLPRPQGCMSRVWPLGATEHSVARVGFGRPVRPSRTYAFGISVRNPAVRLGEYRVAWTKQQLVWSVRVVDATGNEVEAIEGTAALDGVVAGNRSESWELAAEALLAVPHFRWGSLLPYVTTLLPSHVTVLPLEFRADIYVPLRLTAAMGFIWEEPSSAGSFWTDLPNGATAPMPGGLPSISRDIYLQWSEPVLFRSGLRYGFRTPVRVPAWPQTSSHFYLEFGYPDAAFSEGSHPLGFVISGPELLQVARNPMVDYLTGRVREQQEIIIRITTTTIVYPDDGFLFVGGPATIRLYCTCPQAKFLTGLSCTITNGQLTGYIMLQLVATASITPGTYHFPFACTNPRLLDPPDTWTVGTYERPQNYPQIVPVDAPSTVAGFGVQPGMPAFERAATPLAAGFDPRARRRCGTILTFRLSNETTDNRTASHMRLRAPEGTQFNWRCLDEVITNATEVFGPGVPLPSSYSAIPPVLFCEGHSHIAYLHWEETIPPLVDFAFRVDAINPLFSPTTDVWTLEVDGQSSGTTPAIAIQAFEQVTLEFAADGARSPGSMIGDNTTNRVQVRFVPTVAARTFNLTAPHGYDFGEHEDCDRLRLLGRQSTVEATAAFVPRLRSCTASGQHLSVAIDVAENWALRSGTTYFLDADILMPSVATPASVSDSTSFNLLSEGLDGPFGDEYFIATPEIRMAPLNFSVTNVYGEIFAPMPVEVDVEVTFNSTIGRDERIVFQLPFRFRMDRERDSLCPVVWQTPAVGPEAACECDLQTSLCTVTFTVLEDPALPPEDDSKLHAPWFPGRPLRFTAHLSNPIFQPSTFENFFVITHFPPAQSPNWTTPYGVGLYRGWPLISPVQGLRFSIAAGSALRAGATGVLHLTFIPSNDATVLEIRALEPIGWSFLNSSACLEGSLNSCFALTTFPDTPNLLELRNTDIVASVRFVRELRNTRFALLGGPSAFSLRTFSENSQGQRVTADMVERQESFRLPGRLETSEPLLRTTRMATHPLDILWAQLPPRQGLPEAVLSWRFTLSEDALPGDWLSVQVIVQGSLELDTAFAQLTALQVHPEELGEVAVGDQLPFDVQSISATTLRFIPSRPLKAIPAAYGVRISGRVLMDLQANGAVGASKFLNVSLCRQEEPLPIATNDGEPPGNEGQHIPARVWAAATPLPDFSITALGAAPSAQVIISGSFPNSLSFPAATLVAPVGVRIVDPCSPSTCARIAANFSGSGRHAAINLVSTGTFSLLVVLPLDWYDDSWVALTPGQEAINEAGSSAVAASLWQTSREISFRQMPVSLAYPAVGGVQGVRITVSLHPGLGALQVLSSMATCYLRVQAPAGYGILCDFYFRTIYLPDLLQARCAEEVGNDPDTSMVVVAIGALDLLNFGSSVDLVFAFGLELPSETPERNIFVVELLTARNETVDANTEASGLPIPPDRLSSSVLLDVLGFENLAWLQAWATAAQDNGAIAQGLAEALAVPVSAISVDRVLVSGDAEGQGQGLITVDFSALLSTHAGLANSIDVLQPRFGELGLNETMASSIFSAAGRSGLVPLTFSTSALLPVLLVSPPNVTNPTLRWTSSAASSLSEVTLGLVFREATTSVSALLFQLPQGFQHQLQALSDLHVTLNGAMVSFPVHSDFGRAWVETRTGQSLRVLVDRSTPIEAGGYTFRFPVRLPQTLPSLNVWSVCLCLSVDCDSPEHSSVIVVFAIPGFRINEVYPRLPVTAAAPVLHGFGTPALVALLLLLTAVQMEFAGFAAPSP